MLKDDDFSRKSSVDRYGRKIAKDAGKKELERMYRLEDEDKEDEEEEGKAAEDEDDSEDADDDEVQKELARVERKYDPAREGGFSSSEDDSDEDEEDEAEVQEEDAFEFPTGGKEAEVQTGEVSSRLAVVNLDWDNIRAADLLTAASSFAPDGGRILKVTVYPSEFGRERMEREETEGPPREIFNKNKGEADSSSEEDSDSEDERIKNELLKEDKGEEFDSRALRQYQLERLRYYYAVIEVDSPATGRHLYDNMDGREYLSSANFFDLRFVPDDVSFEEDRPRDVCDRIPDGYRPNDFVTDALTHSRVKLTWDADDNARKEVQKRAFSQKEIDDNDLQAYIGSDSSSGEDSGSEADSEADATTDKDAKKHAREEKAAKLRAALGLSSGPPVKKTRDADKAVGDMQVTFTSGLSSAKESKKSIFENQPEETTKEKYVRLERERKARRKDRQKARRQGIDPEDPVAMAQLRVDDKKSGAAAAEASDDEDAAAEDLQEEEGEGDENDPFNDPFFDNPDVERKRAFKEAKKADKARKRAEREEHAAKQAAERAQLELLMADDETGANAHLRHFDINEIEKAEKKKQKKKGKKGKKAKGEDEGEAVADQEGFEMNTQDPRFKALFESHEYAIDPTNPRFRGTKGMKALLEEGRKKRKVGRGAEEEEEEEEDARGKRAKKARQADGAEGAGDAEDLKKLVERVKGKTKRSKA